MSRWCVEVHRGRHWETLRWFDTRADAQHYCQKVAPTATNYRFRVTCR